MPGSAAATTPNIRKSSLRVEELPGLAMNGFHPFGSSATATQPSSGLLNPISHNIRKFSGDVALTPPRPDIHKQNGSSPSPTVVSPTSATSENSPAPWSSAIGHATTSGKSGRVIERLMTENDKLKRDLNEQLIKCQELEKNLQTYKPQIEALRAENDNLSHARGVDSNLISRRDRKIEELKAELSGERSRREKAEGLARQREREKEEVEESCRRDVQRMEESTRHATLHAEILEKSHKQLAAEYRARAEAWRHDLSGVADGREQDRQKLARLDVVADQMRTELERSKKLNGEVVEAWAQLRVEQEERMRSIVERNDRHDEKATQLSREMDRAVDEMRWVMGVKKNAREF